jgi:DNA-binding transcriptional LysR family regulator
MSELPSPASGPAPGPDLNIDVQTLRIVKAIHESGSITGAAKALGTTQPAISQYLQRAERRLAISLIVHRGRTIELTEAGQVLSQHAQGVLDALAVAGSELTGLASLRSGRIRIAGFPSVSATIVPHLIARIQDRHQGLSVNYTEAEPPEATEMVVSGQCDLAFVFSYQGEANGAHHPDAMAGLTLIPLFIDPLFLLVPADHPLAAEESIDVDTLEDDQWIAGCPRCRTHLLRLCEEYGYAPEITYETDNFAATVGMVDAGLGISLIPRLALGTAALPSGVAVKKLSTDASRLISILVPTEKHDLPAIAAAVSTIRAIDGTRWRLRQA